MSDISKRLSQLLLDYNNTEKIKSLKKLEQSATEIGKSWCGSWFGYHSCVYYDNFAIPPAGAQFSSEWGFIQATLHGTRGNWKEYQFDEVINRVFGKIEKNAIVESRKIADENSKIFGKIKTELTSILETAKKYKEDLFIDDLQDKVKKLKIFDSDDFVSAIRPTGKFMSRDALALSKGLITPPHISILSEIASITSIPMIFNELKDNVDAIISHLDRQEQNTQLKKQNGKSVFIGHGRSQQWKDLKDFIQDRLNLPWDEFNRIPVAGITNISRLSEMLDDAIIAFLIFTAEDEQLDGKIRARENVVHEAGLFQGRLGFSRAIIVFEDGCEEFSNIHGLGQIRFPKGNIKSSFEEIRQVLEREEVIT